MANQRAKVIDVTRSYVPVDPDSYPDNYHGTGQEDSPEERVPVVPYNGQNFLPTSYGYKSYFGTSATLPMDALTTRIDHILMYQSATLVNALVVMAEDGIYTKTAADTSDWTHAITIELPSDPLVHYEWTYCVINNELYMYRQGGSKVYKIEDVIGDVKVLELSPNFLNMEGQVGIFKAGGRLGFWDSDNSFSWSSVDDYMDFEPSVTTLAGNAKWTDQIGNVVAVHAHADGFLVYTTKSIIWAQKRTDELNLYKAVPVFTGAGIAYPRQVAVGIPDSVHYAWTTMGVYKIENGIGTPIIPEVFDMMKMATQPIYLKLLNGRYLFIESLDPDFISGKAPYRKEVVPETPITFPGAQATLMDAIDEMILKGDSFCYNVLPNYGGFADQVDENGAPATGMVSSLPGDAHPTSPNYQAQYTCYLRPPMFGDGEVEWKNSPCAINGYAPTSKPFNLNPTIPDFFAARNTTYRAVTGDQMYTDGRWTIERFVAVQTAMWKIDEQGLAALKAKLRSKQESDTQTAGSFTAPVTVSQYSQACISISVPGQFMPPKFGMNKCSFWLTRYAIGKEDVSVRKTESERGEKVPKDVIATPYKWTTYGTDSTDLETAKAQMSAWDGGRPVRFVQPGVQTAYQWPGGDIQYVSGWETYEPSTGAARVSLSEWAKLPAGYTTWDCGGDAIIPGSIPKLYGRPSAGCWINSKRRVGTASLIANDDDSIRVYPDTAYCVLTGYTYTKADGSTGTVAANACGIRSSLPDGSQTRPDHPEYREVPMESTAPTLEPADDTGLMCSTPFEPVTVPGTPEVTVDWPDETVTIPETSFFLRDGSYAPLYPIMSGSFMYDLHLKKWGKIRHDYRHLFDYSPINKDNTGIVSINFFGITGGLLGVGNTLHLFDDAPADSWITWGKIGYYRLGMTSVEEVKVHFKTSCTGALEIEGSLEGHYVGSGLKKTFMFNDTKTVQVGVGASARWHNITLRGRYDISYMEYRGFVNGRR